MLPSHCWIRPWRRSRPVWIAVPSSSFRDQHLTDDAQRAFTRNFGTLEASPGGHIATAAERRLPLDMQDASNLDKDQKPLARDDRRRMFNLGNRLWHSDSSYRALPAKYSLMSGRTLVGGGGGP